MIEANQLSRSYGDFKAVDSVSFTIPRGAIVGLLGHNGAGKTTIMKMITGYLEPSSGTVSVDGIDVAKDRLVAQAKIGYLPESGPLYPEMSVLEYLEFVASLRSLNDNAKREAINLAVKNTHLEEKATSPIRTLSRGYKQRVGVAQAILHQPELLILDEPTNGLDPSQIHDMRRLIKSLSATSTVIISTHILQEVHAICDRVLILSRGKLVLDSELNKLSSDNQLLIESNSDFKNIQNILAELKEVKSLESLTNTVGRANVTKVNLNSVKTDDEVMNISSLIAKKLVSQGIELYSLKREARNLEAIFQEVSQ